MISVPSKSLSELESLVGSSHVTTEDLTIEPGKVEEFARAIGDDNPVFRNADAATEAGSDQILAPLTFLRTQFFDRYRPDHLADIGSDYGVTYGFEIGFDIQYTMHAQQEYEYEQPLAVGMTLTGTTTLSDISQSAGDERTMTFAEFDTEFRDEAGGLVAVERATNVEVVPEDTDVEDDQ